MYYFPVKINERRIHYCELREPKEPQQTVFNFIVQKSPNTELVSINNDSFLISDKGSYSNVLVNDLTFEINKISEKDSVPVYELLMKKGNFEKSVKSGDGFLTVLRDNNDFKLGIDVFEQQQSFQLKITYQEEKENKNIHSQERVQHIEDKKHTCRLDSFKNLFVEKDSRQVEKEYINFSCQISFNICSNTNKLTSISAAFDFGSEATQIRMGNTASNIQLVEAVRKIAWDKAKYEKAKPNNENEEGYWQGKTNDCFFKSKYWVNFQPEVTSFTDVPMQNGERTFVQMLNTFDVTETKNLYPLPNLKLLELAPDLPDNRDIKFADGTPEDVKSNDGNQLTNVQMQENILRLLISSFLQTLLHGIHVNSSERKRCLQFVFLAPNVYSQERIYKIVEGVYNDFNSIKNQYASIKGIEVQVLSESDASFLGFVNNEVANDNINSGDYFLIIDAGKGTTDFSVIRAADRTKFDSIYRFGIPASGNFITYSLYEALCKVPLKDDDKSVQDIVSKAMKDRNYKSLWDLSKNLEELKIKHSVLQENNDNDSRSIVDMTGINSYLGDLLKKEKRLPNAEECIKENIKTITNKLEDSLQIIIKNRKIRFQKVYLAGRGFCFKPFADSVRDMLMKNGLISDSNSISQQENPDLAKSICMKGALKICLDQDSDINYKSMLIGSAVISRKRSFLSKFFHKDNDNDKDYYEEVVSMNEDFYYKGVKFNSSSAFSLKLNGRIKSVSNKKGDPDSHHIFFVGSKFIDQTDKKINDVPMEIYDDKILDIAKKSMFPFYCEKL